MFKQLIRGGEQKEVPDKWLDEGNPWEITRLVVPQKRYFLSRKLFPVAKIISCRKNYFLSH
jgi:glucan phosphorylase